MSWSRGKTRGWWTIGTRVQCYIYGNLCKDWTQCRFSIFSCCQVNKHFQMHVNIIHFSWNMNEIQRNIVDNGIAEFLFETRMKFLEKFFFFILNMMDLCSHTSFFWELFISKVFFSFATKFNLKEGQSVQNKYPWIWRLFGAIFV